MWQMSSPEAASCPGMVPLYSRGAHGPVAAVLGPARVNAASRSSAGLTDCWLLPRAMVMVTLSVIAEAEWV